MIPRLDRRNATRSALALLAVGAVLSGSGPDTGPRADELSMEPYVVDIDLTAGSRPFDRRLLGTNVPAWIRPEGLRDPKFRAETIASGTTLLRMPGGSWSNQYDWLGCEVSDPVNCFATWAARPSDFAAFMRATGLPGMWTVSINETAHSAAAVVAFFNGDVDDDTNIGIDRNGVDWMTVGTWAKLRTDHGHRDPVRIDYWEVGNEVYGGRPEAGGDECRSYGWERVWTCDGTEYALGTEDHDGFVDYHREMTKVDPTIQVGAVGVADPQSWNNWGEEVIREAGELFDFYVVHEYPFDSSPDIDEALDRPPETWAGIGRHLESSLGAGVPIAVTEYNLVSFYDGDTEESMTTALTALFIADTIGQLATNGVSVANQWNLANGAAATGTDYGMINLYDGSRRPQFYAMSTWARAGSEIFPTVSVGDRLRIYPTLHDDGRTTLIALNQSSETIRVTLDLDLGEANPADALVISHGAEDVEDTTLRSTSGSESEVYVDSDGTTRLEVELPQWSVSAVETMLDG